MPRLFFGLATATLISLAYVSAAAAVQQHLTPLLNAKGERELVYDWPILRIGTGEYREGPTGVTVFHFERKVSVAIDARGGGPGTVNAEYMRLGYDLAELDTVVFAGGSWYGLEAVTAVATGLKDDGIRDGNAFSLEPNIAMSVGAIIFDFGSRRLNEIYPDKRLAQAAYRAARHGVFPLGPQGAGRFTKSGGFFGCHAFSGQGGAVRQIGEIKIAAFTVVNSLGVVTDRQGLTRACYGQPGWPQTLPAAELLANFPASRNGSWSGAQSQAPERRNTTISLVVVNQQLSPALLQRLAVQVHTSMARAIQPFATVFDGDVLYAVSTNELTREVMPPEDLGTLASEVMWDAVLSSVPAQPPLPVAAGRSFHSARALQRFAGDYVFSRFASLGVTVSGKKLFAKATGERPVYAIGGDEAVELQPVSATDFMVPSRYPLTLRFDGEGQVIVNPGHWQQVGRRQR